MPVISLKVVPPVCWLPLFLDLLGGQQLLLLLGKVFYFYCFYFQSTFRNAVCLFLGETGNIYLLEERDGRVMRAVLREVGWFV